MFCFFFVFCDSGVKLTNTLHGIQHPQPQPERSPGKSTSHGSTSPGDILAYIGSSPQHLRPAGGSQTHCKNGQDPGVVGGQDGEEVEYAGPDADEEDDDEDDDLPYSGVLAGPEVEPIAAIGGAEPVVLDDDDDEEPLSSRISSCIPGRRGVGRTRMILRRKRDL